MKLRPYQSDAIDAIYAYFNSETGHPLVVIPTAGGKSLVMAAFIRRVLDEYPGQRILILTHVRELVSQDHAELIGLWPTAPTGVYCAGLRKREIEARILFASIQSVHRRAYDVQQADLVLIDEAHLIPRKSDTMYRRFLHELSIINPRLKVVGFTATPFRLDSGMLHESKNALFTDIAFDISVPELIERGFLSPLISKSALTQLDVTGVGTHGGEFIQSQLAAAVDRATITDAAVNEIVDYGMARRSWLIFCVDINHAKHVGEAIRARGFTCATVFGDTPSTERDSVIEAFKRGEIRALASVGVLTTGFNAKAVDLVGLLRPTKSAGLYIQMVGRGTRLSPETGKTNCLILDFGGNIKRHGPIDAVKPCCPGEGKGDTPVKACPECGAVVPASARTCPICQCEFPAPRTQIMPSASELAVLSNGATSWVPVSAVRYCRHTKAGKPPSLRVEYHCGNAVHREWMCLEHGGYARQKAANWWRRRAPGVAVPSTVDEALDRVGCLRAPTEIAVRPNGRFSEVVGARFA